MNQEQAEKNIAEIKKGNMREITKRKLRLNNFVKFCYFINFSEDFDVMIEQFKKLN